MSKKDNKTMFEKLERLNAQIDVWIDEEDYKKVFDILKCEYEVDNTLFKHRTCSIGNPSKKMLLEALENPWLNLFPVEKDSNDQLPIKKVIRLNLNKIDLGQFWSRLFYAKLIRAKIQERGTDCYLRWLDLAIIPYLERKLPVVNRSCPDVIKLNILYLLEMAACGLEADPRSFAERARRVIRGRFLVDCDDAELFKNFYDLWARYNIGLSYVHESNYDMALREFDWIIFLFNNPESGFGKPSKEQWEKYTKPRLGYQLLYIPAMIFRAEVQMKLQRGYQALKVVGKLEKDPNPELMISPYKKIKKLLIETEAYQYLKDDKRSIDSLNKAAQRIYGRKEKSWKVYFKQESIPASKDRINLKSRLIGLGMSYIVESKLIQKKDITNIACNIEDIKILFKKYWKLVQNNKMERQGYLEQVVLCLKALSDCGKDKRFSIDVGKKCTKIAIEIYNANKKYLLPQKNDNSKAKSCSCKDDNKSIDLKRLEVDHFETYYKGLLDYLGDSPSTQEASFERDEFLKYLEEKLEPERENLEWRKHDYHRMLSSTTESSFPCEECLPKSGKKAFEGLLYCSTPMDIPEYFPPCVKTNSIYSQKKDRFLKAKDYEHIMRNYGKHFTKHLEDKSIHSHQSTGVPSLNFMGLRRWNSSSPAKGRSVGGGYFLYNTNKKGCVDLGIAIDPGFDFVRNFFHMGFSLADINIVLLSHAHVDHVRDFESMLSLLLELSKREEKDYMLHAIMTDGVYRRLKYLIESTGYRKYIEPYIIDAEKDIGKDGEYLEDTDYSFRKDNSNEHSNASQTSWRPIYPGDGEAVENGYRLYVKPKLAYHNDHSFYSDSYGFNITIEHRLKSGELDKYSFCYTGDTRWHDNLMKPHISDKSSGALLIHMGSLIDFDSKDENKKLFSSYKKSNDCFKLVNKKNHPYLFGLLHFLQELSPEKSETEEKSEKRLVLISEFGEELRGGIRVDLLKRLKKAYSDIDLLPVDVGLNVQLHKWPGKAEDEAECGAKPAEDVWCVQCQSFVDFDRAEFETYGQDEALFCVCKTCQQATPVNVLQERLRSIYEEGIPLRVAEAPEENNNVME